MFGQMRDQHVVTQFLEVRVSAPGVRQNTEQHDAILRHSVITGKAQKDATTAHTNLEIFERAALELGGAGSPLQQPLTTVVHIFHSLKNLNRILQILLDLV